jgi:hypothetical protein
LLESGAGAVDIISECKNAADENERSGAGSLFGRKLGDGKSFGEI